MRVPIPRKLKNKFRSALRKTRRRFVRRFRSYGRADLCSALRKLGLREGDSIMLHAGFDDGCGFRGTTDDVITVVREAIGERGNLLMVSLPYLSSSSAYLAKGKRFDVRKTPSAMGLISEFFRRRPDVLRSVNPAHPILAQGPDAADFLEGHEHCVFSCGPGSPFHRLLERDGKVIFFNTTFDAFTFFHHLEHIVNDRMPFPLYTDETYETTVIDAEGNEIIVSTRPFSCEVIHWRRFPILEERLRAEGIVHESRIGNTRLIATDLRAVVDCVERMMNEGVYFYDVPELEKQEREANA